MPEETSAAEIAAITEAYRSHVTERVKRVYIFGDASARELEHVFVELGIVDDYRRPSSRTEYHVFESENAEVQRRSLKPDDLLQGVVQAVIAGAPGCGKTTLLKYLTLKILEGGQRIPVFVELKTISKELFEQANNNLDELLFNKAASGLVRLGPREREVFRDFFFSRLAAGEVALFLDGLDEVRDADFFTDLCNAINEFKHSEFGNNTLIISARPYALRARFEGLKEMEVAPLNLGQIRDFLIHYYGNDPATKRLLKVLEQRRQLRELAQVPFLLAVIANLHRNQNGIAETRLEIYRQIVWQLANRIDGEKSIERAHFYIRDPEGRLKLDFLTHLAFERMLVDDVEAGGIEQENARLVFIGDVVLEKAKQFLECSKRTDVDPYWLASDVKATPLLREVGVDVYAFTHLTIQEYLAAVSLSRNPDCKKIFCSSYFDPTVVEMEVLPMTLGLVTDPNDFYATLEQLPESLNYANLRLRARGLAYSRQVDATHYTPLVNSLVEFVRDETYEMTPYADAVISSFSGAGGYCSELIADRMESLLRDAQGPEDKMGWYMARHIRIVLEMIGGERSMKILLNALKHSDRLVRCEAIRALDDADDERVIWALIEALKDKDVYVRDFAAMLLGEIGDERAIEGLIDNLKEKEHDWGMHASYGLRKIGGERVVEALINALKDNDIDGRYWVIETLEEIESDRSVDGLLIALRDENEYLRQHAAEALGHTQNGRAVGGLLAALRDVDVGVREKAVGALVAIKGDEVFEGLINALKDDDADTRARAAKALGDIKSESAVDALANAVEDSDPGVRVAAVDALRTIEGEKAVACLLNALRSSHSDVRRQAVQWIGVLGRQLATRFLIPMLRDESPAVRRSAAWALWMVPDPQAIDELLAALSNDDDLDVCVYAARALGRFREERALEGLHQALTSGNVYLRRDIPRTLSYIGGSQVAEWLVEALNDPEGDVRAEAVKFLVEIREAQAVDALILALNDENQTVRESAAIGLGILGDRRAVNPLVEALKDESLWVREYAAGALEKLCDERAVDGLVEVLNADNNNSTVWHAERALATIGGEKAIRALFHAPNINPRNQYTDVASLISMFNGRQAVEVVRQLLDSGDRNTRINATKTLAALEDEFTPDGLVCALAEDEDPEIRNIAAVAARARSKEGFLDQLKDREHDIRDKIKKAVENVSGDRLVSALLYVLKNKDHFVREDAAKALETINTVSIGKGLLEAMRSEDAFVRRKSAEVVGYYLRSDQVLHGLSDLVASDPAPEVRRVAVEALNKLNSKFQGEHLMVQVSQPVEVFFSYSHNDEQLRDQLKKHLSILKRQGVIADWHDRQIAPGDEWAGQINEHLNSAGIILLLVSADFLASDYCYDVEMRRAMERHEAGEARVIPIILRPCDWHRAPFGKLQALPKDAKPVTTWPDRDEALLNIAHGIQYAAERLRRASG